ncbi:MULTISPECIES: hypothetical protein [Arthrobacter]|uniref:Uncharacterized protein n=1 Tax=Arthrobacter terricola TaxID=2547396 RepID=A0A4V2ZRX4_9MICC|nr:MULTISPECIES: hypothetical protein [Arthrobacter]MBT8163336.1 hypothetical protein [Arthrobacter sp. GN70]TDF90569.1 hypothetical protein E1809_22185 [Arthrobacter terricola]
MSPKKETVHRPLRRTEHEIVFGTTNASKGWTDVLAVQRNTVVEAWERLTKDPLSNDLTCHGMKGDLEFVTHKGATHRRRQYELSNGARIWFYVHDGTVVLIDVHTHHPNATK